MRRIACLPILIVVVLLCSCSTRESSNIVVDRSTPATIDASVEQLLAELTLDEKISLVHANSKFTVAGIERLGIPEMHLSDGPHGVRQEISRDSWAPAGWTTDYATYLPPLTAVAASWDREVASLHGKVLGAEARHRNKDIILGPGVNLARLPTYGRNFEYFGEDPFLAAEMVIPEVIAIQENDVAACVKHYALNTQELNRWNVDAQPDERSLREVYLPAFEAAVVRGGALSLMGAYNRVYGTNANQNRYLVTDILKGDWGFEGVLLTDWHVDINTQDAAMNGLDLEMGTKVDSYDDYFFARALKEKILAGEIPESILDDKVRRVLRLQVAVGMMDPNRQEGARNTDEHRQAARQIAEQGIVLLKNEKQLLPLARQSVKKVLVLGPNANLPHGRGGGSSQVKSDYEITPLQGLQNYLGDEVDIRYLRVTAGEDVHPIPADYISTRHGGSGTPVWQVNTFSDPARQKQSHRDEWPESSKQFAADADITYLTMAATLVPLANGEHVFQFKGAGKAKLFIDDSLLFEFSNEQEALHAFPLHLNAGQAYRARLEYDGRQNFVLGWQAPGSLVASMDEALAEAKSADAVFYFGGLNHNDDREGRDRPDMTLPGNQDAVISRLLNANKNTVVFIVAGSAVEMPWVEQADTLAWGWYGGMEAGNAYARMLFGDVNPGGKMPITLPHKYTQTAPIALNDYNDVDSHYKEGVFIGYRWFEKQNIEPMFAFGHGLSYTRFDYADLNVPEQFSSSQEFISLSVNVVNIGEREGSEVVQLYLSDSEASVERPAKELKGFNKVQLKPGEQKTVNFKINQRDLSFWDVQTKSWKAEPGKFRVLLGSSSADIRQVGEFNYQ